MFVVDYLRRTGDRKIKIASYHRGHLGLLPETPVSVSLVGDTGRHGEPRGCEIFVTPFDGDTRNLFKLKCTMLDQPGVVDRLLQALRSLKINIVKQESACIDHNRHHTVRLLLDWRGSLHPNSKKIPRIDLRRVRKLSTMVPHGDFRYFRLAESIVAFCGDVLTWQKNGDVTQETPAVSVTPFEPRDDIYAKDETEVLQDTKGKSKRVYLQLSETVYERIRETTGHSEKERIPYIVLSESNSRTLRVFFPKRGTERKLVHVAFSHNNMAGALSAATELIAKSNFNIITSLLRRETRGRNIWEVHLEHKGEEEPPQWGGDGPPSKEISVAAAKWMRGKLALSSKRLRGLLKKFDMHLATPRYPITSFDPSISFPLFEKDDAKSDFPPLRLEEALKATRDRDSRRQDFVKRAWVYDTVAQRKRRKPSIFYSYPETATSHAKVLMSALEEHFEPIDYQASSLGPILDTAVARIRDADFFLAIWHPDERKSGEISPWLPVELGIAIALDKDRTMVAYEELPDRIWKRVTPEISIHLYQDVRFESKTVPIVRDFALSNWSLR